MKWSFKSAISVGAILTVLSFPGTLAHAVTADDAYQSGVAYYKQGQMDQAISQLKAAIELNPNYWQAYQVMGYAQSQEGNSQAALDSYNKSLQINANNPQLQQIVDKLNGSLNPPPNPPVMNSPMAEQQSEKTKNYFYFNIGGTIPVTPSGFADNWSDGFNLGAGYGFQISKIFSITLDATYSYFPINQIIADEPSYINYQGGIGNLTFLANARLNFVSKDNPVVPYVIAGLGPSEYFIGDITATNTNTEETATLPGKSETDFAFRIGLGIDFRLSPTSALFFETNGLATTSSQYLANNETVGYDYGKIGLKFAM